MDGGAGNGSVAASSSAGGDASDQHVGGALSSNGRRSGAVVSINESLNSSAPAAVAESPEKVVVVEPRRRVGGGKNNAAATIAELKLSPDAWKSIDLEEHSQLKNDEKKLVQHMSVSELRSKLLARNIPFDYREIKTILLKRYIAYVMLVKTNHEPPSN